MTNPGIFREYDIRGIVGTDLTPEFAADLGRAFAAFLLEKNPGARKVSVGRDARLSSAELAGALISGITASGIDVVDIGLCPTPLQYFSIHHLGLDGGIMVTGSHNPPEYNGFKISAGTETIFGERIQKLRKIIDARQWAEQRGGGTVEGHDIVRTYKNFMIERFCYLAGSRYRALKVVVDAGNGTAGIVAPDILVAMGCEVYPLYCEPDGRFPNHHPDPTVVDNITDLIRMTREEGADIGIGYDGDGDRIGVVNPGGEIVWGDQLMIILGRDILSRRPGATVIADVKCSQVLFDDIARHGGRPVVWKTGHSLVKMKMKEEQAPLAGEFSGHIFIGDDYFGFDDALFTTFRLIEIMKKTGQGIDGLLFGVPRMKYTPEIRIDCPDDVKERVVAELLARFREYAATGTGPIPVKSISDIDGVKAVFSKGWALARMSNTQPVVVMRFEAEDDESLSRYRDFMEAEFRRALQAA